MATLFQVFFRICLMRSRPQDLPAVRAFLFTCITAYLLTGTIVAWPGRALGDAFLVSLADTLLLLLCAGLLLVARSHPERMVQTVTALTGTGVLFNLIAIPLVFLINQEWLFMGGAAESAAVPSLLGYLILFLLCWNVSVIGFVYKHALDMSFMAALIVAVACVSLSVYLINLLPMDGP
jgi:hypothetical protein